MNYTRSPEMTLLATDQNSKGRSQCILHAYLEAIFKRIVGASSSTTYLVAHQIVRPTKYSVGLFRGVSSMNASRSFGEIDHATRRRVRREYGKSSISTWRI